MMKKGEVIREIKTMILYNCLGRRMMKHAWKKKPLAITTSRSMMGTKGLKDRSWSRWISASGKTDARIRSVAILAQASPFLINLMRSVPQRDPGGFGLSVSCRGRSRLALRCKIVVPTSLIRLQQSLFLAFCACFVHAVGPQELSSPTGICS